MNQSPQNNMSTIIELSSTILSILSILLFAISIKAFIKSQTETKKKSNNHPLPPGPKPWPIVGSLPELLKVKNKPTFRWINKLMGEMNAEIICIRLGNTHVIPVASPEIACEFLKQQDHVFTSRPICSSAEILSAGYLTTVLTPYGDQWKKMRKILLAEVVSSARHRWLQRKRDEESDHVVHFMYNICKSNDGLVNIRNIARHYCGNVMRKIMFGKRFFGKGTEGGGPGQEEEDQIRGIFTSLQYLYAFSISDYIPCLRGYLDLDCHEKIMRDATAGLRKYQDPIIDERVKQWRDGEKNEADDILDVLVALKDAKGDRLLCPEEIKAQIMELFIAAVDNPSHAVEWTLAEMLNQPRILETALEELDRVVGHSRLVQESDISQLNYLKACIKESFRLHPITCFNVPHVSNSDTTVAGYFIPKGSHILLSRPGLGRNPRVWPEPLEFRPDRHLEGKEGGDVKVTDSELRMLSFSSGKRGCVAPVLGTTMAVMLLARLIHGFSYSLPRGVAKIELKECLQTMELIQPLVVTAKPRLDEKLLLGQDDEISDEKHFITGLMV